MHGLSLHELSQALKAKKLSSLELTQDYLRRIYKASHLNAFISVNEAEAIMAAKVADSLIQQGNITPLTGIPMAHKDIFCVGRTTCASKMLANFDAPYSATIVKRLQAQGAVMLGKTNMDEFAMGSSNENSYFGAVKNPWSLDCVPGGSSGGSAAAVAANLVPFATGSDTGGSIRQPAAFCGVSGIKPTYGLVSRFGMVAFASSLDQAGPIARSVEDLAIVLQAMAGYDANDSTSVQIDVPHYAAQLHSSIKGLRIGLPTCFWNDNIDSDILTNLKNAVDELQKQGATVVELNLSMHELWVPCYYVIACAEASSNLSRYDGVRFGYQTANPKSFLDLVQKSRSEAFGTEVKRRILTGTYVLSSGYYDAYYLQAQKVRRMIRDELTQALLDVDVIIGPTTPSCAFKIGEKITDPTQRYLADTFTVGANLAGLPALSIPIGFNQNNLPIGMQLIGPQFGEAKLLNVGFVYQQNTDWHKHVPAEYK